MQAKTKHSDYTECVQTSLATIPQCPITTVHIKFIVQAIKELFKFYGSLGCPAPADASTAQLLYSRLRNIMEDGTERLQEPEDQKIYCVF